MFGLVDGNNFYASCERVFNPALRSQLVVVLSNNDWCVIARSNEAKALGVKMGQPVYEVPAGVRRQLHVRSANFALYGDMSGRVVDVLRDLFTATEVYSIDESFVDMRAVPDRLEAGRVARHRILQWTGIPCCVGIGPTKTLAKLANKLAKGTPHGVVEVGSDSSQLESFPVEDIWGVGRKWAARLGAEGIFTAGDLVQADPETVRRRYGVVLGRTQRELQGLACAELEENEPDREDLAQALVNFAVRACEKLRARSLQAGGVWVWMNTNPFKPGARQYHPSRHPAGPAVDGFPRSDASGARPGARDVQALLSLQEGRGRPSGPFARRCRPDRSVRRN